MSHYSRFLTLTSKYLMLIICFFSETLTRFWLLALNGYLVMSVHICSSRKLLMPVRICYTNSILIAELANAHRGSSEYIWIWFDLNLHLNTFCKSFLMLVRTKGSKALARKSGIPIAKYKISKFSALLMRLATDPTKTRVVIM